MNQTIGQPIFRVCYKCKYEGETVEVNCPQCRRPMQSRQQIKILGVMQIFIGLLLGVGMAIIIYKMNQAIADAGSNDLYSRASNSPERLKVGLPILYGVLAFGVVNIINGIWHSMTGRRHMLLLFMMFGMAIILLIAAEVLPIIFT